MSFHLDKYVFLRQRVEYIAHDILCHGNYPAQSKFNLIDGWQHPTSGQSLFSFIGLVNFFNQYTSYTKIRLKP